MAAVIKPWAVAALLCAFGCGQRTALGVHPPEPSHSSQAQETLLDRYAPCDNAKLGAPCGASGSHMHCVAQVCVRNVCGDGAKAENEECDDGNDNNHDGCTDHCLRAEVEDDTSSVQAGRAASGGAGGAGSHGGGGAQSSDNAGRRSVGGSGAPGQAGGHGGQGGTSGAGSDSAGQGGSTAGQSGADAADGGMGGNGGVGGVGGVGGEPGMLAIDKATPSAECAACREANCRDYGGDDVVSGCLERVNAKYGASEQDASFIVQCKAVVSCAIAHHCAYGLVGAPGCYCGSRNLAQCESMGPALDNKCAVAYQAASRSSDPSELLSRKYVESYPIGWANQLLDCDKKYCLATCAPNTGVTTNAN